MNGKTKLNVEDLIQLIESSIVKKSPLSIIRLSTTECQVLAQGTMIPEEKLHTLWFNGNDKILRFKGIEKWPNYELRDDMIDACKKADVIGYLMERNKRCLWVGDRTRFIENFFKSHQIEPPYYFDAFENRKIPSANSFFDILKGKKAVLLGRNAGQLKPVIKRRCQQNVDVVAAFSVEGYSQIPDILDEVGKHEFDIALISAGCNAVILAAKIAERYGKVAFDWGFTSDMLIHGVTDAFQDKRYYDDEYRKLSHQLWKKAMKKMKGKK